MAKRKSRNQLRKELERFRLSDQERGIVQRFVKKNGAGYLVDERDPTVFVNFVFREPIGYGLPTGSFSAIGVAVRGSGDEFNLCQGMAIASKRAVRAITAQVCAVLEGYSPASGKAYIQAMKRDLRIED